jgi:hypothetical protein
MPIEAAMAVPRPVLLALVGLGLLASLFLVTRSGTNESVSSSTKAGVKPAIAPSTPPPARKAGTHTATPAAKAKPQAGSVKPAAKPSQSPAAAAAQRSAGLPARVQAAANALAQDKVVVFLFSSSGAADDVGARLAVDSLRGMRRVAIFDASLDEVAAYRPMLSNLGISQIPSTVIVRPGKKAVLLQGFVDAGTLRQNVADALR